MNSGSVKATDIIISHLKAERKEGFVNIQDLSKSMLGKALSRGSLLSAIGGFATGKMMASARSHWEAAKLQGHEDTDALLDQMTLYDIAGGAGKLLEAWLRYTMKDFSLEKADARLRTLIETMDEDDILPEEKAHSRFIVSKALFRMEGLSLMSSCRYEGYQREALLLLRKNPGFKRLGRNEVFRGEPFKVEDVIATTHRMLLMLDNGQLKVYMQQHVQSAPLKSQTDYMALLIAITVITESQKLSTAIGHWFKLYCDFKIQQNHRREALIQTSLSTVAGGLPASIGMDLFSRLSQKFFQAKI